LLPIQLLFIEMGRLALLLSLPILLLLSL